MRDAFPVRDRLPVAAVERTPLDTPLEATLYALLDFREVWCPLAASVTIGRVFEHPYSTNTVACLLTNEMIEDAWCEDVEEQLKAAMYEHLRQVVALWTTGKHVVVRSFPKFDQWTDWSMGAEEHAIRVRLHVWDGDGVDLGPYHTPEGACPIRLVAEFVGDTVIVS